MAATAGLLHIRPRPRLLSSIYGPKLAAAQHTTRRSIMLDSYIVTPKQLSQALLKNPPQNKISTAPRIIPLCATWFLPNDPQKRTGRAEFEKTHIPSARFFDLDAVRDQASPYPHILPSAEQFANAVGELGIRRDDSIVVYDDAQQGLFSAPRVGWTFRVFGHAHVHLLNNFRRWVEEGYPTESGAQAGVEAVKYLVPAAEESGKRVAGFEEVREVARDYMKEGAEGVQILDARPGGRWKGTDPEPREGLSSGHIPGSISIPFSELLDPITKTLKSKDELVRIFTEKGVDPTKPIISSCGTGVTAAVIDAALDEAEFGDPASRALYDGSWTEWAQRVTEADGLIKKSV